MINVNEIYLLNEALDSEPIYGLSDKELRYSKTVNSTLLNNALNSLKNKKIMNDDNTFNELSYLIIKNLKQYKDASEYIWFNDFVMSKDDSEFMLLLRLNKELEEYSFTKTTNIHLMYSILKEYSFLQKYSKEIDKKESIVKSEDFVENYCLEESANNIIIIKKEKRKRITVCSEYFAYVYKKEKLYKYDVKNEVLKEIAPQIARIEIANIIGVEVK